MLERVKTKHQAEKMVLGQEIVMLKHVTKMIVKQCKQLRVSFSFMRNSEFVQRDKTLSDIRLQSHKKLVDLNKRLKDENEELKKQCLTLSEKFNGLKRVMIAHEYD